ncbi:MAG: hypothetical protein ABIQ01_02230 [Pseudolysinimonas sp.]
MSEQMSDETERESDSDREDVADAVRARQSLEGDVDVSGEDLGGPGFTGGERAGALRDFEETDADVALDDDDVETGDE